MFRIEDKEGEAYLCFCLFFLNAFYNQNITLKAFSFLQFCHFVFFC